MAVAVSTFLGSASVAGKVSGRPGPGLPSLVSSHERETHRPLTALECLLIAVLLTPTQAQPASPVVLPTFHL